MSKFEIIAKLFRAGQHDLAHCVVSMYPVDEDTVEYIKELLAAVNITPRSVDLREGGVIEIVVLNTQYTTVKEALRVAGLLVDPMPRSSEVGLHTVRVTGVI